MSRISTLCCVLVLAFLPAGTAFTGLIHSRPKGFRSRSAPRVWSVTDKTDANEQVERTQDEFVKDPASMVYYDDVDSMDGVVCARGVCAIAYDDDDMDGTDADASLVDKVLNSYLGPRAILAGASILYGTNFPLGVMMNEAMPPSAATAARTVLAALALSPFLFKLNPKLAGSAILCGSFTALGYITQSISLIDTSPATVAFLGAATVIVCPTLEFLVNKKPMGLKDAPQTWLAATLCILGVGVLELYDPTGTNDAFSQLGFGDVLAILQAIGFGTSFFITERMMRGQPDQALPITAVQVSMSAFFCMIWCFTDGWMGEPGASSFFLSNMFFEPTLQVAAGAVAFTGLITTALNRFGETTALGKVSSAEASVILATEPLWAALFAALWLHDNFGLNDYIGGFLIVLACLANALKPENFDVFFNKE